ncbi:hypothetical protein ES705_27903 [subsurface metagenome]
MEKVKCKKRKKYELKKAHMEKNSGNSVTVPGQSYTVGELLEKHIQGNLPDVRRQEYYEEDPDLDNMDPTQKPDFDLADATLLQDDLNKKIVAYKKIKEEKILENKKIKEEKLKMYEQQEKNELEKTKEQSEKVKDNDKKPDASA